MKKFHLIWIVFISLLLAATVYWGLLALYAEQAAAAA